MRAIVCLERRAETQRVLWLNESKSGIYVGIFNGVADTHASYHQDGIRHFRAAKDHHQRWKDTPLAAHSGLKHLMHSNIGINEQPFQLPTDPPTTRDQAIVLHERDFHGYDSLAVDVWLSDAANEERLVRMAKSAHLTGGFKHLGFAAWDLENFRALRCGISLWAASTRASAVEA